MIGTIPILAIIAAALLASLAIWGTVRLRRRSPGIPNPRAAEPADAGARLAEEQALRASEARLRLAARAARFGTFDLNLQTGECLVSAELKEIAGLSPEAELAFGDDGIPAFVHPDDRQRISEAMHGAQGAGAETRLESDHRIIRPDGEVRWVRIASEVIFAGEGADRHAHRFVGAVVDITEQREANEKFRGLVEQALAGIYIIQGGYIRYANPAFAALFGYPSPEAVIDTVPVGDFVAPEDRQLVLDNIRARVDGSRPQMRYDFRAQRYDGTVFTAEVHGRSIEYRGRPAVIGVVMDITGRKRAEEALRDSEADLRRAQSVGQIGNWRLDVRRNELLWSDESYRIFGIAPGTPLSYDTFLAAVHPDDRAYVDERWQAALRGEPYDIEHRIVVGDEIRWVRERAELEFGAEGKLTGGFGTAQEITERKEAQEALERKAQELQRINAELEEFAYIAAHDLKAPLRAVANLALVIDEDAGDRLDEENRARLRLLRERMFSMDRLIGGLLEYARLGNGPHEPRAVALGPLINELVAGLQLPAGFKLELQDPLPTLTADASQLQQIFYQLIGNAVQHHDRKSGTVWIRAHPEDESWCIEVSDDGPGIPTTERPEIFRMFTTGAKRDHHGIGLAAVRKLVLLNGGRIEVAENRPRGTLFRIAWPK